jgi:hypothetical protein
MGDRRGAYRILVGRPEGKRPRGRPRRRREDNIKMLSSRSGMGKHGLCVIAGFRRGADEICSLLGYYIALNGSSLPTFRDNLSVPSSRVKKYKKKASFLDRGVIYNLRLILRIML